MPQSYAIKPELPKMWLVHISPFTFFKKNRCIFTPMKRSLFFLLLVCLAVSCGKRPEASPFLAPELGECGAQVGYSDATIFCPVSRASVVTECGIVYSVAGGNEAKARGEIQNGNIVCCLTDLKEEAEYCYRVFAGNGRQTVYSPEYRFTTPVSPFIRIADPNFRRYLVENFDTDHNGGITPDEALAVEEIRVCTDDINTLQGIENFKNLTGLECTGTHEGGDYDLEIGEWMPTIVHGRLTRVDLSANLKLKWINLNWNKIVSLDLPKSGRLRELRCEWGDLRELDLTGLEHLTVLDLSDNRSLSLDLPDFPDLMEININNDAFESVDISASRNIVGVHFCSQWYLYGPDTFRDFPRLESINFCGCRYSEMDFSQNTRLMSMWFSDAQLEVLDLRNCPLIEHLEGYDCYNLKTIYLHTGCAPRVMNFSVMPEIIYVD